MSSDERAYPVGPPFPSFRLADGLRLVSPPTPGVEGVLVSERPLVGMRLNAQAARILAALSNRGFRTPAQIAAADGVDSVEAISGFLERCAARGLLERRPPDAPDPAPRVSVVVPTIGDRVDALVRALDALAGMDWSSERVDVHVVVDDDDLRPVTDAVGGRPGVVIHEVGGRRRQGPSAARNVGARHATGDWVAFLDDDCVPSPRWLAELAPHLAERGIVAAAGRVTALRSEGSWLARYEALRSPLDMGPRGGDVGPAAAIPYVPSTNLVVDRVAFLEAGGFDEEMRLGEDVDLVWRLAGQPGARLRYAPEATVAHEHRVALLPWLRRRIQYASSEAALAWRHPASRRRLEIPPLAAAVLLSLVAAAVLPAVGLVGLAAAAMTFGVEVADKLGRTRRMGLDPRPMVVVAGSLRSHGAALYHLGAHVTRYHGLVLVGVALTFPPAWMAVAPLVVVPAAVDHRRRRATLPFPLYLLLWWLEMGAYQLGVLGGCVVHRDLRPLFPRIGWMAARS